jgi:hypothetical protein
MELKPDEDEVLGDHLGVSSPDSLGHERFVTSLPQSMTMSEANDIRQCLQRARACAEAAARSTARDQYLDCLARERNWITLALSYSVAARVQAYCEKKGPRLASRK